MENLLIKEYAVIKRRELRNNPYSCLDSNKIDINPHQVEAFCFALSSIQTGGAILADEVGLGKTIEAGLVIKYLLNNNYRKILLIMPSNLRKQWQMELEEKFDIESLIVDSQNIDEYSKWISDKNYCVIILSYNFAAKHKDIFDKVDWDFAVFDEAHRLRNIHKNSSKTANRIYGLTMEIPKIMLTATPMQNTLLDMFGLVKFIDDKIFLDKRIFNQKYIKNQEYEELKNQIQPILQRTLRSEVADYLQFKSRVGITVDFRLTPMEGVLYKLVNDYLKKEIIYAIPLSNRNLITVVIRKLLASSSRAVSSTFEVLKERLIKLKEATRIESVDKGLNYFFDFLDEDTEEEEREVVEELYDREKVNEFIQHEINQVTEIINVANNIKVNAKLEGLKNALNIAFERQEKIGVPKKVVIFTESVRTQEYLYEELSEEGYKNSVLVFNGNCNDKTTNAIYKAWKARNYGKLLGSRSVELKNAIVEAFKSEYQILLVTDSGSEGLNLQFCNTVINYDLPWNPQRIEQRIGRCHRYGQKNDTIVINLLNTENVADRRVYEILSNKFQLFEGVFGASDKAIGLLEGGQNFEQRILQIYQQCKSPVEFNKEFRGLEKELDKKRNVKFQELKTLISNRDEEEHKQSFNKLMKEVDKYFYLRDRWMSINKNEKKMKFPVAYEIKKQLVSKKIMHGYIFIGGFYDNEELLLPVLCIYDLEQRKVDITEAEILDILEQINDNDLREFIIRDSDVSVCGNEIYDDMNNQYMNKFNEIIMRNHIKIDNWVTLRTEDYNLQIQECKLEIEGLKQNYMIEKNFKAKIELKRKIESVEKKRSELMVKYHDNITSLEKEANNMKNEFEKGFVIEPLLLIKIIVKF